MPKLPTVAIIGRPNTGKSTLFNRLIGVNKAIVSEIPGTTRDHVAQKMIGEKADYLLIDTGGMGGGTDDADFEDDVHSQSVLALEHADIILLTVNSQEELTASDFSIADILRKNKKKHVPIIMVLTKCDNPENTDLLLPQYYELAISDNILSCSSLQKIGLNKIEDAIEEELIKLDFGKIEDQMSDINCPKIAIIGKPNVGKSSIINAFMSETQRSKSALLVSDIPGTTRDSTDTIISYHNSPFKFIDTAGIKRRKQTKKNIETFAYFRSIRSLEESDICVLVLDANEPISKQEKRIAGLAVSEGKGLIILVNKSDIANAEDKKNMRVELERELAFCRFAPIIFCSATSREGLQKIFDQISIVQRNRQRRIEIKELRRWYEDAVANQPMSVLSKAKHITQAEEIPPTFVLFVKNPKQVQVSQLRYLENNIRKTFAFEGTPIRWITKNG